jgi:large subunit ribosomal protein L32
MGLPGHRRTSSHKRRRAAHFALTPAQLTKCPKCGKPVKPHNACAFCGTYQGRQVTKAKAVKKTTK